MYTNFWENILSVTPAVFPLTSVNKLRPRVTILEFLIKRTFNFEFFAGGGFTEEAR